MGEPANVVEALARVAAELPSIGKDRQASQQQGGYSYRGIEAITRHAAPLLAKYGVVFAPDVQHIEIREITVNGKPWTDTVLTVGYRIHGPGGADDHIDATVVGIGRDNADKGANKALTQAFKYVLTQTLCVADGKDDDGATHEADELPPAEPVITKAQADAFKVRLDEAPQAAHDEFVKWKADQGIPWPWPVAAFEIMNAKLDELLEQPF